MLALEPFLEPKTIAVIGASNTPDKPGYMLVQNLLNSGFPGKVYAVNRRGDDILGLKGYKSVKDIPGEVDLADVIVPSVEAITALKDCAGKGVKAALIAPGGFAEMGMVGAGLEKEIVDITRHSRMRVIGPNTVGWLNTANDLINVFAWIERPKRGCISVIAQSGGICLSPLIWLREYNVGFSKLIGMGNKCDIDETDALQYLAADPETRVIGLYLEDIKDGQRFLKVARVVAKEKALVVFKSGRTEAGKKATRSHTAALAGDDDVYESAFRQSGIIRVETLEEFFDYLRVFACQPLPQGNRTAVLGTSGGHGVLAADALERHGLKLAELSPQTIEHITKPYSFITSVMNPVDLGPITSPDVYEHVIEALLADENVDGMVLAVFFWLSDLVKISEILIRQVERNQGKPVTFCGAGFTGVVEGIEEALGSVEEAGIPIYPSPERAVGALGALYRRQENLRALSG